MTWTVKVNGRVWARCASLRDVTLLLNRAHIADKARVSVARFPVQSGEGLISPRCDGTTTQEDQA